MDQHIKSLDKDVDTIDKYSAHVQKVGKCIHKLKSISILLFVVLSVWPNEQRKQRKHFGGSCPGVFTAQLTTAQSSQLEHSLSSDLGIGLSPASDHVEMKTCCPCRAAKPQWAKLKASTLQTWRIPGPKGFFSLKVIWRKRQVPAYFVCQFAPPCLTSFVCGN